MDGTPITFRTFINNESLACPVCGDEYVRQASVAIYHLPAPAGLDIERQVLIDLTTDTVDDGLIPAGTLMNPSHSGREGIRIAFYCETGCDVPDLLIAQDKGNTRIEWDHDSKLPKRRSVI
jgi:hypothetical protein